MKTRHFVTEELETHLWYDYVDGKWKAYTNLSSDYRKFKEKHWKVISEVFADDGTFIDATFEAGRHAIHIAEAKKREYTEEERKEFQERAKKMLEARNRKKKEKEN